ncbi:MAG: SEL1-like repeat protein [Hyphomicrobiales bacterium]|nr:SEL1-like repeat protein [Hyphomicrobiales bacterium]MDE2113687.1 SEL1-like repeat protein [Hyphomicrobiales bacterium]
MSRAVAWSVDDMAPDALDLAQMAADRAGKSLNDWLHHVIADQAEAMGVTANEIDHNARLEAVAAKLARLTSSGQSGRPKVALRTGERPPVAQRRAASEFRRQGDIDDLHGRVEQASADFASLRASASRRKAQLDSDSADRDRYADATNAARNDEVINEAIAQFERRTRDSQKKATSALSTVAEWIEINEARRENDRSAIENVAKRLEVIQNHVANQDSHAQSGTRDVLERVSQRLQDIEEQVAGVTEQSQQKPVRLALARLEGRLEALAKKPVPEVEDSLRALDRKLEAKLDAINNHLDAKVNNLAQTLTSKLALGMAPVPRAPENLRPRSSEGHKSVNEAIAAIGRRQRDLDNIQPPAAPAKASATSDIDRRLEAIAARLESATLQVQNPAPVAVDAQSPALVGLHGEISKLSTRLDEMRAEGARREEKQIHLAATALASAEQAKSEAKSQIKPVALDPQLGQLREQIANMANSLGQLASRASVSTLEDSLRDLGQRIEASRGAGAQENLLAPVEQLAGELRTALRDLDPTRTLDVLHNEIVSLNQKVESISRRGIDAESFLSIQRQTAEIRELLAAAAAKPLPVDNIERQIAALSERIDKITSPAQMLNFGRAAKPDMTGVAADIRGMIDRALPQTALQTIEDRLAQLDQKIAAAMNQGQDNSQLADIALRMEALQRSFVAPQPTLQAGTQGGPSNEVLASIGTRLDQLDHRLSDVIEQGRGPEHLLELSQRVQDMQASLNETPHTTQIDLAPFEGMLRDLSQKMESSRPVAPQEAPLQAIEALLQDFATRIEARPPVEAGEEPWKALEPHLNQILEKLNQSDNGLSTLVSNSNSQFEKLSHRIDDVQIAVAHQLEQVRVSKAGSQSPEVSGLVEMMRTLNEKIDIVRDSSPSPQAMGEMLQTLAQKMDAARAPAATAEAIRALEVQIQRIAQQLEKSDHNQDALAGLEQTVNELLAQIENGQFASLNAAEAAARAAAQDALREALRTQGSAADPAMLREIDELRELQQDADKRNNVTLHILHETLEKIVDRLTSLEVDTHHPATTLMSPEAASVSATQGMSADAIQPARLQEFGSALGNASQPLPQAGEIKTPLRANAAPQPKPAPAATPEDFDDEDFLIEPGKGNEASKDTSKAADAVTANVAAPAITRADAILPVEDTVAEAGPRASRKDFIAAARRAAQVAAIESVAATPTKGAKRAAKLEAKLEAKAALPGDGKASVSMLHSFQQYSNSRRKPILLTLSALALLIGALRIFPAFMHHTMSADPGRVAPITMKPSIPQSALPPTGASQSQSNAGATANPVTPANPVTSGSMNAAAPKLPGKSARLEGVDLTPTGTISPAGAMQLPPSMDGDNKKVGTKLANLASAGNAAAQYTLAMHIVRGDDHTGNSTIAAQWLERAAASGLVPAQYQLGVFNEKGIGVKRNMDKAKSLYQQAAQKGNVQAMYNLAVLTAEGSNGKPDYADAAIWFRKAAERGVRDAQYNLAILYARGLGVHHDPVESYVWFDIAARQGDKDSAKNRDEIASHLDSRQLATAKKQASEFTTIPVNSVVNKVSEPASI